MADNTAIRDKIRAFSGIPSDGVTIRRVTVDEYITRAGGFADLFGIFPDVEVRGRARARETGELVMGEGNRRRAHYDPRNGWVVELPTSEKGQTPPLLVAVRPELVDDETGAVTTTDVWHEMRLSVPEAPWEPR